MITRSARPATGERRVDAVRQSARILRKWAGSLSNCGIIAGLLAFSAALTPTLIPRGAPEQGALGGLCLAVGYLIGVFCRWLWRYMQLPDPAGKGGRIAPGAMAAGTGLVLAIVLWRSAGWQNAIRSPMGLGPVGAGYTFTVCLIALAVFLAILVLARLLRRLARFLTRRAEPHVPPRVARVIGVAVTAFVFWSLTSDIALQGAFRSLDSSYREIDGLFEPERKQPSDPGRTGSSASLVKWAELGRMGRRYVASGPSAGQISAMTGRPAKQPIRVYVGLGSADTARARAKLALAELKRQGGFDRSVLLIITPTGTGWVDPSAIDSIEYLHHGDIASVAMQYSYLSSPLTLLVHPENGAEAAQELFTAIYGYWSQLPRGKRPALYLHGLSLGAMNSEKSVELFGTVDDPIAGAVWSGPPFASPVRRSITARRNRGSPVWLPQFRDNRIVRFANQDGFSVPAGTPWGNMRIAYLQYASDAIVFFDYRDLYRKPEWMKAPVGPDVSPDLQWYPIVTMAQTAMDMPLSMATPMGYGHVYAPEHYIDAWVAVTDVRDWSPEALAALRQKLGKAARNARAGSAAAEAYAGRGG
ncbi:MAG: alpha/beta-hydrolase family protein [Novosphingobium sp.]|jgi:uncharacterized membrane protein|nr:alpha/beta-hydrolase family protein [Novosphingobium sp.]